MFLLVKLFANCLQSYAVEGTISFYTHFLLDVFLSLDCLDFLFFCLCLCCSYVSLKKLKYQLVFLIYFN